MDNKTLNSAESLELITRMIAETRGNLERGGGNLFLIWGYLSLIVSALVYGLLYFTKNPFCHWLWFLIPIVGWSVMFFYKRKQQRGVKTQIDRFIGYIWIVVGLVELLSPIFFNQPDRILAVEALVLNIGVVLTGAFLSFRPLVIGGVIGILLSYLLCHTGGIDQIIIFAVMFLVVLVIPGHKLNYRGRCLKS